MDRGYEGRLESAQELLEYFPGCRGYEEDKLIRYTGGETINSI
jgi:hypothetical protein